MKKTNKRILFAANLESFFIKFLIPQLKYFYENGYEVHVAAKSENINIPYCHKKFDIDFARGFNIKQNIHSYKQMKEVFKSEHYDIVSCHTPFGGGITRLAFKNSKVKNTRVVYMNHGFHFYKGAPLLNWLLFYPAEKYLSKFTHEVITINLEDYEIAKKKFKCDVSYVAGVGLDPLKFDFFMNDQERIEYKKSLGLKKNDFVMMYPAEINKNKRQEWLVDSLKEVFYENSNFHLLLPGNDMTNGSLTKMLIDLKLENQVHLLGFRKDIPKLLRITDLSVSTSNREGLPVNIMEAVYCGIPVVATACRGNRDLIKNGKNGYIVAMDDKKDFSNKVLKVSQMSKTKINEIKKKDEQIITEYLLDNVLESIVNIYKGR